MVMTQMVTWLGGDGGVALGDGECAAFFVQITRGVDIDEHYRPFGEGALKHGQCDSIAKLTLNDSLKRAGTERWVVAEFSDTGSGSFGYFKYQSAFGQPAG